MQKEKKDILNVWVDQLLLFTFARAVFSRRSIYGNIRVRLKHEESHVCG